MLNLIFKGTEKSGPAIDKGLADVVNEGLRTVGQSEEVKKLHEKFIRPSNVDNLRVPKVEQIIFCSLKPPLDGIQLSRRGVGDKPVSCKPGVAGSVEP